MDRAQVWGKVTMKTSTITGSPKSTVLIQSIVPVQRSDFVVNLSPQVYPILAGWQAGPSGCWWLRSPQKGNTKTLISPYYSTLSHDPFVINWYPTISPAMSHLYIYILYIPFFYGGDTQVAAGWITKDQDGEQRALALRPGRLLHSRQSNRAFKDQNVSICKFRKWSGHIWSDFLGTPLKPLVDYHGSSSILVKRCHLKRWPDFAEDTPAHICWILYLIITISKLGLNIFELYQFKCGANQLVWGGFMMIMTIWVGAKGIIIWIYVYNDLYRCCFFLSMFSSSLLEMIIEYIRIYIYIYVYIYTHTLW